MTDMINELRFFIVRISLFYFLELCYFIAGTTEWKKLTFMIKITIVLGNTWVHAKNDFANQI